MATEDQIQQLEERYVEVENRRNYCCRDIVIWKTYTRIVSPDGVVLSNFADNCVVGTTRRGMPFTVTFTPKLDTSIYEEYRSVPTNHTGTTARQHNFSNNYEIRVPNGNSIISSSGEVITAHDSPQIVREAVDYILMNSSSSTVTESNTTAMSDVGEVLPASFNDDGSVRTLSQYTGRISKPCSVPNAATCAPLREFPVYTTYGGTDGSNFYTYKQTDDTLTIDVKDGGIFRGIQGSYPDDPAYLAIFVTQFVTKARG